MCNEMYTKLYLIEVGQQRVQVKSRCRPCLLGISDSEETLKLATCKLNKILSRFNLKKKANLGKFELMILNVLSRVCSICVFGCTTSRWYYHLQSTICESESCHIFSQIKNFISVQKIWGAKKLANLSLVLCQQCLC